MIDSVEEARVVQLEENAFDDRVEGNEGASTAATSAEKLCNDVELPAMD